jgi:hypothetical protein
MKVVMQTMKKARHWSRSVVAVLVACLFAPAMLFAQGCALCYTQAAGSGSRMIAALRSGILILMVPPMLICIGITWMAYKKRNQFNDYGEPQSSEDRER